jgi:hypothetical protein
MKNRALVVYFVLAYAISWTFMLPVALSARGIITANVPYALYYLASFGPALSALIVTGLTAGRTGLRSLLGRLLKWRVPFRYYVFAVFSPIALLCARETIAPLAERLGLPVHIEPELHERRLGICITEDFFSAVEAT